MEVILAVVLLAGELAEAGEGFQESFLARVFGIGRIAGHAKGAAVKTLGIGLDHLGKGRGVTEARAGEVLSPGGVEVFRISWFKMIGV